MTLTWSLRPGVRAWRIGERGEAVLRCVVIRARAGGRVELAPSLLSPMRFELRVNEVFGDKETAQAELRRRRDAKETG
ncbi:MAG TPA: hypothetical protein VGL95_14700 [Acetobacteraceae bacterium]|jgi:hypothetical protein